MENDRLERVIGIMLQIPPIMHRKLNRNILKAALEQVGGDIALHHLLILKVLHESGVMHSSEIGEMIAISKSQMTHSIDRLARLGLVERQPNTEDKRMVDIRLTQKGREKMERLNEITIESIRARLSVLRDDELEKLAESYEFIAKTFTNLQ